MTRHRALADVVPQLSGPAIAERLRGIKEETAAVALPKQVTYTDEVKALLRAAGYSETDIAAFEASDTQAFAEECALKPEELKPWPEKFCDDALEPLVPWQGVPGKK